VDLSKNYFELFGLPVGFGVDAEQLKARYRELQRVLHPDRYAGASDQERRLSMQGATLVNEALQTLKDPMLRGRYLLSLYGIGLDAHGETTQDAAFLMEQMELREELEEARHHRDPQPEIRRILAGIDRRINTLVARMALHFEDPAPEQLTAVSEVLRKMQFLQKLRRDAERLEEQFDEV
jgi:molecular chaperone HscB